MAVISRFRWPISLATVFTLMALIPSLALAASTSVFSSPLNESLVQISSDPFTNSSSQHKTEVEPDVYSNGQTVVATFQQGRFTTGGASDNGWATSHDGGATFPGCSSFACSVQT